MAKANIKGRNLQISSSMVFTAFSIEAYLNHLGETIIGIWQHIERKLSPSEKLDLISSTLGLELDYSSRPFQTFKKMFAFRNALAHGRTESLTMDGIQIVEAGGEPTLPKTSWQEEISIDNASRYLEDAKEMIELLNSKADVDPYLLWTPDIFEYQISPIDEN